MGKAWAITGVAAGFLFYVVPGFFALRSYTNWMTGKKDKPLFAWVWAWISVPLVAAFVLFVVALSAGAGNDIPTFSAGPVPKLPALSVVFHDDLSDPSSGWQVAFQDHDSTAGYEQGTYRIAYSAAASNGTLAFRTATFSARLVSVQADIRQVGETTPRLSSYAIGCTVDPAHYYSFIIDPGDGEWRIVSAGGQKLAEGFDVNAIHGGSALNRVRGVCDSRTSHTTLILFVNGQEMGEAHQDVAGQSYTGMFMAIAPTGAVEVRFDNAVFSAYAPSTSSLDRARQETLDGISVHPADLSAGYTAQLLDLGDQVAGQVTLDLCAADFPSEALRVARRQVQVLDSAGRPVMGTEAVLYRSPNATAQALRELRHAAATCPSTFVASRIAGVPPLMTVLGPQPDRGWPNVPGVRRLAFDVTWGDRAGHRSNAVLVYLARGDVLLGLYFYQPNPQPSVAAHGTVEAITMVFESRLAQLPPG